MAPPRTFAIAPPTARILLVDDHEVVVTGLTAVLRTHGYTGEIRSAADAAAAHATMRDFAPNLCIFDLVLGGKCSAFTDTLALLEDFTLQQPATAILVFSGMEDTDLARRAITSGARGFMAKSEPLDRVPFALETISAGSLYLSPKIFSTLDSSPHRSTALAHDPRFDLLTNRERHILHATALRVPNRRIAADLSLSVKTIETHKEAVKRKLTLANSVELERAADRYLQALLGLPLSA